MCGICGEINFHGEYVSPNTIETMMKKMNKRGPDAKGLFMQHSAVLGHCRLKIIDLSEKAQQPMIDNLLGFSIVFNGAIYNYKELRDELTAMGYLFFSQGDTEVILKAYHAWGPDCVKRFNGMFAFAIHHRDSGRVFLARDRMGIKPLYYVTNTKRFRFASSLPALLVYEDIDTNIDPEALQYYMTFHAVVPPPHTILKGIKKLPPATTLTIDPDGTVQENRYWRLSFKPRSGDEKLAFEDWKSFLEEELINAIERRLTADVPVGVLLSGGLDSSLVVGLLAKAGQKGLKTFSIGFESVLEEKGNEFEYSDIIANHFQTEHHKKQVGPDKVLPSLMDCVAAMNEPMVSHDCIGFYLLSEMVSKSVKVVESGQGADEIFAGYHWYPYLMESQNPEDDYAKVFFDRTYEDYANSVDSKFPQKDYCRQFIRQRFMESGAELPIDKALYLDSTVMLVDDPVKRVDSMTMAWGLEARVPFLDHKLVELAARIPARYKVRDGGKYILKEIARNHIPHEVIDRPKGYFPVPSLKYLRGEYLDFVKTVLNQPAAQERVLFNREYLHRVLAAPDDHITPLRGSKLWQMALLEFWLQVQGV